MSEKAFARGLYYLSILALGLGIADQLPLSIIVFQGACVGFLSWRVEVLWRRES